MKTQAQQTVERVSDAINGMTTAEIDELGAWELRWEWECGKLVEYVDHDEGGDWTAVFDDESMARWINDERRWVVL